MTEASPMLNELWSHLVQVLKKIYNLESLERKDFMSQHEFMQLFNSVNQYFISLEYNNSLLIPTTDDRIRGDEFYCRVKDFFRTYLEEKINDNNREGEIFLEFYAKTWERYQTSSQIANGVLSGLNKGWVARQKQDSRPNIHDVQTLAMHIWQDFFFKDTNQSLIQTCLKLINKKRNGEMIKSDLIKHVVRSYVSAGFAATNSASRSVEQTLQTYIEFFETPFLQATEEYYRVEVENLVANYAIVDYARKVYQCFIEEENQVKTILHEKTLPKIQKLLTQILIANQIDKLQEELIRVLREEKSAEISLLFNLVNRVDRGNDIIIIQFEKFAKEESLAGIQAISSTANEDPNVYCEAIITVCLRFLQILNLGFSGHSLYAVALDKAFGSTVNSNAVTQAAGKSMLSAELLAGYCDVLLRKGNKLENVDIEEKFNHIMMVFNYIEDKDAFLKFYGRRLAKRLVNQSSASDDLEAVMISKLKNKCGFEYTSKLELMIKDISVSNTLITEYESDCKKRCVERTMEFYVMVLRSNAWPFVPPAAFILPIELRRVSDSFTNFYSRNFTGRKLEWLYQFCKGELQANYGAKRHIFQVSTYQMTILLLFNSDTTLTVEDIQKKTNITLDILRQVLVTLLKPEVLTCPQVASNQINNNYNEKNIQPTYEIQLKERFTNNKVKINLNIALRTVERQENEQDNNQINEDRKIVLQAAIVRIMKTRKELKHALLVQEVIQQLCARFKPSVQMIKKCIELLIEKEYLERNRDATEELRYLA